MVLRQVEDADIATFHEHWTDDVALRMAAFTPAEVHDRAAFEARWTRQRADPSLLVRTIERDGEVVGSIGSWGAEDGRQVTYWIGRRHWGQGIASEALRMFLELERTRPLHAAAAADNTGSLRVLERCGFRVTGSGRGWSNARATEVDEVELMLDS
jgi:RimJ/RimL family protein N-acetyltransferase